MATETYELRIQGVAMQERNECVLHFISDNVTANLTFENGNSLVDSFETNILTPWLNCLPTTYYLDRLSARRATPKPSAVYHRQYENGEWTGNDSGDACTDQLCPSIFLIPPAGTKSGGRIFMPCVENGRIDGNAYQAGYVAEIGTLMTAMLTNFGVSGVHWQLAIFSRKHLTSVHAMAYQLSPRFGFQKRRRSPV